MERHRTPPVIIDIEASGFGKGSYPIEIGVATDNGESRNWLIRPEDDWTHWQPDAEKLHGIQRETLVNEGLSPRFVAGALNELFEGQILYTDGWGFDSGWLSLLFYVAEQKMLFKLETLPKILSQYQLEHWDDNKAALRKKHGFRHHSAEDDARLLQLTYQKTAIDEQLE